MVVPPFSWVFLILPLYPGPAAVAMAIRAGFGAIHAEKKPPGRLTSLGAWHFGVIVWGKVYKAAA